MDAFERKVLRLRKAVAGVALVASGQAFRSLHRAEAYLALAGGVVRPRSVEMGRKRRSRARPVAAKAAPKAVKA